MPLCRRALVVAVLLLSGSRAAAAQATRIRITASPALMRISAAVAGFQPTPVVDASTTYQVRVQNGSQRKITARLDANMPAGTTLRVTLAAPAGGVSLGAVTLDITDRDVVVAIPVGTNDNPSIIYEFSATLAAGVVPSSMRTVTYTLVNYP
jgi:hypothetical protein